LSDLAVFIGARLDEEQRRAEAMEHFIVYDDTYYSCPATRTEPHGDLPWGEEHCTCQLAARKAKRLREIAAGRAILRLHAASHECPGDDGYAWYGDDEAPWCPTLRHVAAIWDA